MIYAGDIEKVQWSKDYWIIFDIGFSNKLATCGLLFGNGTPHNVQFGEAVAEVIEEISRHKDINLVIEAPLSVAFDKMGNPKGRTIEKRGKRTRYWYFGAGCTVLVATTYFLRQLYDSNPSGNIKLFEGLVSWKIKGAKSDHAKDVLLLMETIKSTNPVQDYKNPSDLTLDDDDVLESAFKVAGMDFGIPPVIIGTE